jgi:leader peptidase (prepilin peptidase)/N-methyltransferase
MLDALSLIFIAALGGLLVGSLLNTIIHRLPVMLERQWANQSAGHAQLEGGAPSSTAPSTTGPFNLWWPRSHCPHCQTPLGVRELVPLLSWLWQRGRCRHCLKPISARYPLVEALTALAFLACVWRLPADWTLPIAWLVTSGLIALAFIDWETQYLPDTLTLPLMWLGLLISVLVEWGWMAPSSGPAPVSATLAIVGASLGYLSLWSVYWVFKWVTGKEGMGYGDFKLLAALGAWLGPQALLPIILLASIAGTVVGLTKIVLLGGSRHEPLAFGPYLALAGWVVWLA